MDAELIGERTERGVDPGYGSPGRRGQPVLVLSKQGRKYGKYRLLNNVTADFPGFLPAGRYRFQRLLDAPGPSGQMPRIEAEQDGVGLKRMQCRVRLMELLEVLVVAALVDLAEHLPAESADADAWEQMGSGSGTKDGQPYRWRRDSDRLTLQKTVELSGLDKIEAVVG